ncbi:MAG: hypothetical protein K2X76_02140 [Sphingomonas sp.]|nr:hypothetical protein [Sphingomonas sp.]
MAGAVAAMIAVGTVAPALGAAEREALPIARRGATVIGFTPASADPKLAAMLAKAGIGGTALGFTPAEPRHSDKPVTVTVAVRARSTFVVRAQPRGAGEPGLGATNATPGLAPIAYDLGVSVGWQRFALPPEKPQPGNGAIGLIETSASLPPKRPSRVRMTADAQAVNQIGPDPLPPSGTLDVGGAYRLTRHVDLTAGVRYKDQSYRIDRGLDSRRDSQAVFVGTALRF